MPIQKPPPSDCSNCGVCCRGRSGTVLLLETDLRRWADAGRPDLLESRVEGHFGQDGLAVDELGDCVHLEDRRCSIYELRPEICREVEVGSSQCMTAIRLGGREVVDVEAQEPER